MSETIENRIVEMQFNNKEFEKGVQQSITSIGELKKSLDFTDAKRNINELKNVGKAFDFSSLSSSIKSIDSGFLAMGQAARSILTTIANDIYLVQKKLFNLFTVEPAKTGLSEYETQLNAVQTVLANTQSKGTTLDDVNKSLDELNIYADKTIYNFTEMARNIGTFTAAGVGLEDSTSAIKGIANLAAVSGSNSQQASTAMYQLSQALAAGTVKLMDWNSVVNAGMGGEVFQEALKRTARVHGVQIDEMIKKEGSFRETLAQGWLTSDILIETLKQFAGELNEADLKALGYADDEIADILKMAKTAEDAATKVKTATQLISTLKETLQSGWTQTWEIIFGDYNQAKILWTSISDYFSDVINDSSNARNATLEYWSALGGRAKLINGLKDIFSSFASVISSVSDAFSEVFPKANYTDLLKFSDKVAEIGSTLKTIFSDEPLPPSIWKKTEKGFRNIETGELRPLETTIDKIRNVFEGLFSVFSIFGSAISFVVSSVTKNIPTLTTPFGNVLDVMSNFAKKIIAVRTSIKQLGFEGWISNIISGLKETFNTYKTLVSEMIPKEVYDKFSTFETIVSEKFASVKNIIISVLKTVKDFFYSLKKPTEIKIDGNKTGSLMSIFDNFSKLKDYAKNILTGFTKTIVDLLKNAMSLIPSAINAFFEIIGKIDTRSIIGIIGIIDYIGKVIRGVIVNNFIKSLTDLSKSITSKIKGEDDGLSGKIDSFSTSLLKIAGSIAILTFSISTLSQIDPMGLGKALFAIGLLLAMLTGASAMFKNWGGSNVGNSFLKISIALALMLIPLNLLADMPFDVYGASLLKLAGLMAVFSIFMNSMNGVSSGKGLKLITMVLAISALILPLKLLTDMPLDEYVSSLLKLAGLMAVFSIFMNSMNGVSSGKGVKLISIVLTIAVLVLELKSLANMTSDSYLAGLLRLIGVMGILVLFIDKMNGKSINGSGILSIIGFVVLLEVFTRSLEKVSKVPSDTILSFSIGLAIAVSALSEAMMSMSKMPLSGALKGAVGVGAFIVAIAAAVSIGGILISGAANSIAQNLSTAILTFGSNIKAYSDLAKNVDKTAVQNSIDAFEIIAGAMKSIVSINTSKVSDVSYEIFPLGARLKAYSDTVKGIDSNSITLANDTADGIKYVVETLTGINRGKYDMTQLGTDIFWLGSAIKLYSKAVEGVSIPENSENINVSQFITDLAGNIPDSDTAGKIQSFTKSFKGGSSLVEFGIGLSALGTAIKDYSDSVSGIDQDAVDNSTNTLTILNDLQTDLPKDGALWETLTGKRQTLSDFGSDLVVLGSALSSFATSVSGVDTAKTDSVTNSMTILNKLQQDLPNYGGVFSFFTGEKDLATFGTKLVTFGSGIASFAQSTKDVKAMTDEDIQAPLDFLIDLQSKLEETGGIAQFFTGTKDISTFGSKLGEFGEGIEEYVEATKYIKTPNNMDDIIRLAQNLVSMQVSLQGFKGKNLDSIKLSNFGEEVNKFISNINAPDDISGITAVTSFITSTVSLFQKSGNQFFNVGTKVSTMFGEGIRSGSVRTISIVSSMASQIVYSLSSYSSRFQQSGYDMMSGLAAGIRSGSSLAISAVNSVGDRTISAFNSRVRVESPSKEFYESGMYCDIGLANGLLAYSSVVEDASSKVGKSALQIANTTMRYISAAMNSDMSFSPTIRPVMNLDDIYAGQRSINGIFSSPQNLSISASRSNLYRAANLENIQRESQNGIKSFKTTDTEVVNAIRELNEKFDTLAEGITNMKVVTETGVLVGQLKKKMDKQLGIMAYNRERGN